MWHTSCCLTTGGRVSCFHVLAIMTDVSPGSQMDIFLWHSEFFIIFGSIFSDGIFGTFCDPISWDSSIPFCMVLCWMKIPNTQSHCALVSPVSVSVSPWSIGPVDSEWGCVWKVESPHSVREEEEGMRGGLEQVSFNDTFLVPHSFELMSVSIFPIFPSTLYKF